MDARPDANPSTDSDPSDTARRATATPDPTDEGGSVSDGRALLRDLAVLKHEAGVLVRSTWDRMVLGSRSAARIGCAHAAAFVVVTLFLVRAAWSVLDGLRGAFVHFSGLPWIGDLVGGLLGGGCVVGAIWWFGRHEDRVTTNEMRAKYEEQVKSSAAGQEARSHSRGTP